MMKRFVIQSSINEAESRLRDGGMQQRERVAYKNALRIKSILAAALLAILSLNSTPALACTNPAGIAGDMVYNDSDHIIQWCDGTNWNGVGRSPYIPNGVDFAANAERLRSLAPLTGVTDSKEFTVSFWIHRDRTTQARTLLSTDPGGAGKINVIIASSGTLELRMTNAVGTEIVRIFSANPLPENTWTHVLASFDLSNPASRHIYIDDVDETGVVNTYIDDFIDFTPAGPNGYAIGLNEGIGSPLRPAEIADLWIDTGTYLDLSDVNIRRKFIDANGWPVDLGADGSRPTGSSPDIFLSGDTATWHTNDGTGGGFTEFGTLTDSPTDPGENLGTTEDLIGWWKLDETSGTTAVDSSENGNDGTLENGLDAALDSVNGQILTAFEFSGINERVRVPDDASLNPSNDQLSASFWIKPYVDWDDEPNDAWGLIDKFVNSTDTGWAILVSGFNNEHIRFAYGDGVSSTSTATGGLEWEANRWYHVAVVVDDAPAEVSFFLDGALLNTQPLTLSIDWGTKDILIGDIIGNSGIEGVMDDVRLYDRVLTLAEIQELYDTGYPCKNPLGQRGGDTMYNATHHVMQYCNLREWKPMSDSPGDGGAGCTNPIGVAGDMLYNSTHSVMQYCEGDTWRAIGAYN